MSLFGTSPDDAETAPISTKSRNSLFDDEPGPATNSKSSLFDDDSLPGSSPWAMPTPKKASKGEVVKSLLPTSDVPDSYIDTFDNVVNAGDGAGGKINLSGISKVLSAGKLSADDQTRIMNIIAPGGQTPTLGRSEFNVLLALIGLAQEREDITLDGVDERRRSECLAITHRLNWTLLISLDLPVPKLPSLFAIPNSLPGTTNLAAKPAQRPATPPPAQPQPISSAKARSMPKDTIDDADPWGSPVLHKGHDHGITNGTSGTANGLHEPVRTTSTFTTSSREEPINGSTSLPSEDRPPVSGLWGSYDGRSSNTYSAGSGIGGDGFGGDSGGDEGGRSAPTAPARAFGGGRVTSGGVEEVISITLLPEKEGIFMFQHHNYQVTSVRRASKVVRRYSDFVWLLDCLQKRYPFRQLPLLPPKRVGGECPSSVLFRPANIPS
jgi:sorting nexin-8